MLSALPGGLATVWAAEVLPWPGTLVGCPRALARPVAIGHVTIEAQDDGAEVSNINATPLLPHPAVLSCALAYPPWRPAGLVIPPVLRICSVPEGSSQPIAQLAGSLQKVWEACPSYPLPRRAATGVLDASTAAAINTRQRRRRELLDLRTRLGPTLEYSSPPWIRAARARLGLRDSDGRDRVDIVSTERVRESLLCLGVLENK